MIDEDRLYTMDLHHASKTPDWQNVAPESRNRWQRLAARSNGVVTPANFISTVGLCLVSAGIVILVQGNLWQGTVVIVLGRLMDAIDGYIATWTRTKSPMGQMVDAGFDKIEALATLAALSIIAIVPYWLAAAIAIQNIANVVLTLIARQHHTSLKPSRAGKLTTAGYWIALALLAAGFILDRNDNFLFVAGIVLDFAYALAIGSLILGFQATIGYARKAFGYPGERYAARDLFDRYIVVQNPVSTDAHKAQERIRELRRMCPDKEIVVIKTLPGGREANRRLLEQCADKLGPRTMLGIAAGDGTVNLMLDSLLNSPSLSSEARTTPILPLWCGNANDLAYILNGRPTRKPVRKVLRRGALVKIRPLSCTLTMPDGSTQHHTAACYASFGASAFATWEMERTLRTKSPIRRFVVSRFGQEVFSVAWALMRAPTFKVSEESGQQRVIFERTHLNGSRFAKVIGLPLRLTDEKFHRATIEHKHLYTLITHIIGLMGDRELSKKTITHDAFTVHDPVWAQFDGEATRIPAGTHVDISMSDQPFYALSVRLAR